MADKKKDETTEETQVSDTDVVSDTGSEAEETPVVEETPVAEDAPVAEEVSDTEAVDADATVSEEVSDTTEEVSDTPAAEADTPAAEEVSDTEAASTAMPPKKQKSQKHVPRSARRTRTKLVREKPATRKPITRTEKPVSELGRRQERRGVVVSDKGDKTIVVKVDVIKSHPKYKKVIRRTAKFHAHDEANTAGVGDTVRIVETRPLSKTKRWRLAEIVEKAR
jgi:ribosomal protein uS17